MPAQRSGTNIDLKISTSSQERILRDVLFGEVWFASGQSNMERSLHRSQDRAKVAARAANAHFRFFIVAPAVADNPAPDAKGRWEIAHSNNVDHFSATACSFAIQLGERKKSPVGIVDSSFGGTRVAAWVSEPTLDADGRLDYVRENWNKVSLDPSPISKIFRTLRSTASGKLPISIRPPHSSPTLASPRGTTKLTDYTGRPGR